MRQVRSIQKGSKRGSMQLRGRKQGNARWFAVESARVHILKQERRGNDRTRHAVLRGPKGAQRGSRKSRRHILEIVEDGGVVADARNIAERAQGEIVEPRATDQFGMAIGNVYPVDQQGEPFATGQAVGQPVNGFRQIFLPKRGDDRVIHAPNFQAPIVAVFLAHFEELLMQFVQVHGARSLE